MSSTYSPNLRLELIANGEQSGTWGNTTNTNLGTLLEQAITGITTIAMSDVDVTLTTTNGATDQARSAVLILTGTNSVTRNVIAPLVPKVYFVKNSTNRDIIIKGATGSGVTISSLNSAIVYCDSTNFVAISPSGLLAVINGGTGISSLTTGYIPYGAGTGAFASSANIVFDGTALILGNGTAPYSSKLGVNGNAYIAGGLKGCYGAGAGVANLSVGDLSLNANSSGQYITAVGYSALKSNTSGSYNTALGTSALQTNTIGYYNTAVGYSALFSNLGNATGPLGYYNTALGYQALKSVTGSNNIGIGPNAGQLVTTGSNNVLIGAYDGFAAPISTTGSNYIVLSDGAANIRQVIDSNGNVGIGTTTTSGAKLTVSQATLGSTVLSLSSGVASLNYSNIAGVGSLLSGNEINMGSINSYTALYSNNTEYVRLTTTGALAFGGATNYGSAGQTLLSAGSTGVPTWGSSLVSGTAQTATGSPASIDFTGIPSWAKRITVMLQGVCFGTNLTEILIQIGTGSTPDVSAYTGSSTRQAASTNASAVYAGTGFTVASANTSGNIINGSVSITLIGSNTYIASGIIAGTGANLQTTTAGIHTIPSGALNIVRITNLAGSGITAGTINIIYE